MLYAAPTSLRSTRTLVSLLVLLGLVLVLGPAPTVQASPATCAYFRLHYHTGSGYAAPGTPAAQTFTPDHTGQLLASTIYAYAPTGSMNMKVEVRTVSGGIPTGTVLGSGNLAWTDTAWAHRKVTFTQPVNVTAGTMYALVFTPAAGELQVFYGKDTPYAGGRGLGFYNNAWGSLVNGWDVDASFSLFLDHGQAPSTDATLRDLWEDAMSMEPTFSPTTYAYSAPVPEDWDYNYYYATASHECATVTVNGQADLSGGYWEVPLELGPNTVSVVVTAESGAQQTYTISVPRGEAAPPSDNNLLGALTIAPGTLAPALSQAVTTYSASVDTATVAVQISATPADPTATVEVVGLGASSGSYALNVGENNVAVVVTAQNGAQRTYVVTITRAAPTPVTVSGITVVPKSYDGTTAATLDASGYVLSGVAPGHVVSLAYAGGATFSDEQAGANKPVTVTGLTLTGPDASRYFLSPVTVMGQITPKVISAAGITAASKTYDRTTLAELNTIGASLVGVEGGDGVALNTAAAVGYFASADQGAGKPVTVNGLSLTGADAANYTLSPYSTTGAIAPIELQVTGIMAVSRVYDAGTAAALDTSAAALVGVLAGEDVALDLDGAAGAFDSRQVGEAKTVHVSGLSLVGMNAGNYELSPYTTTAGIAPRAVTPAGIAAADKVYDGSADAQLHFAGAALIGQVPFDLVALNTAGATAAFASPQVGNAQMVTVAGLSLTGPDAINYTLGAYTTTASITPKAISVSGMTATKIYDGTTSAPLVTTEAALTGLVPDDEVSLDPSGAIGAFDSPTAGDVKQVTVTGLLLAGADAPNYTLNPYTFAGAVAPKPLALTGVAGVDKIYDQSTQAELDLTAAALDGVVPGDEVLLDAGHLTATFADAGVGADKPITVTGLALMGAASGNYALLPVSPTAAIVRRPVTVTGITAANKTYNGSPTATLDTSAAAITGVLPGDEAALDTTGAEGQFSGSRPGTGKTVTVTGLALVGPAAVNYVLQPYTTTANINPVPPAPAPEPLPTPGPTPTPEPTPAPSPDPTPAPEPAPEPTPTHEPAEDPTPANGDVAIIVNGVRQEGTATATTSTDGVQTTTTVSVDPKKLDEKLNQEGEGAVVTLPVRTGADQVVGQLTGQMVKNMEGKQAVLAVKTETASYTLPAERIQIDDVSAQFGEQVDLTAVTVEVRIATPTREQVKVVEDSSQKGNFFLVVPPVEYSVSVTYQDKTVEVNKFDAYVERTVAIPDGVDPTKITTGIVIDPDGTVRHVPTQVIIIEGRYYAKINSLTNSTYSVIWNPIEFADVAAHWAKPFVNEMGSRKVVNGIGEGVFAPDRDVTRAEFAAMVVRALGLKPTAYGAQFSDVAASDWYATAVAAAYEYGILTGYEDGTFRPDSRITRQEAMAMIARAMKIAGMDTKVAQSDARSTLSQFTDADRFAAWSQTFAATAVKHGVIMGNNGLVRPTENITRAETATIIMRMLQKAGLI